MLLSSSLSLSGCWDRPPLGAPGLCLLAECERIQLIFIVQSGLVHAIGVLSPLTRDCGLEAQNILENISHLEDVAWDWYTEEKYGIQPEFSGFSPLCMCLSAKYILSTSQLSSFWRSFLCDRSILWRKIGSGSGSRGWGVWGIRVLDGDGLILVILLPLDRGIYGWVIAILVCTLRSLNQGSSLATLRIKILRGSCAFWGALFLVVMRPFSYSSVYVQSLWCEGIFEAILGPGMGLIVVHRFDVRAS